MSTWMVMVPMAFAAGYVVGKLIAERQFVKAIRRTFSSWR